MIINPYVETNFLQLRNETARDRRLSLCASGALIHILSYSKQFEIDGKGLQKLFNIGERKLLKISKELKTFGYLEIIPARKASGALDGWQWNFYGQPQARLLKPANPIESGTSTEAAKMSVTVEKQPSTEPAKTPYTAKRRTRQNVGHGIIRNRNTNVLNTGNTIGEKKKNDADATRAGAPAAGNAAAENVAASAPSFDTIANFCFGIPPGKIEFIGAQQKREVETAIARLNGLAADLSALPYFLDYWRADWKSLDRRYNKYQPPRPEQIADFWFEFTESIGETARRLDLESQIAADKDLQRTQKQNEKRNDYSEFEHIEFS